MAANGHGDELGVCAERSRDADAAAELGAKRSGGSPKPRARLRLRYVTLLLEPCVSGGVLRSATPFGATTAGSRSLSAESS